MASKRNDFEQAMEKLEKIVLELESEQFPLEESLKKFEEGIELGNKCRAILDRAEAKVKQLVENVNGEIEERDADDDR